MESIIKIDDKYAVVLKVNLLRATLNEAKEFKEYLEDAIKETDKEIVVNLSDCEQMDSTFLGVLVSGYKKLKKKSRNLVLIEPRTQSSIFLTLDSIGKFFPLYNTVNDALQDIENKKLLELELSTLDQQSEDNGEEFSDNSFLMSSSPVEEITDMPLADKLETHARLKKEKTELEKEKEFENHSPQDDNPPVEEDLIFVEKESPVDSENFVESKPNQISFNEIASSHSTSGDENTNETIKVTESLPEEEKFRKGSVEWKFGFELGNP